MDTYIYDDADYNLGSVLTAALDQLFQPPALVREMIVVLMANTSRLELATNLRERARRRFKQK